MYVTATYPKLLHEWLKHETDRAISRDFGTIKGGSGVLDTGTPLGRIAVGAATSAAKAGGNTGNGTLTLDATTPTLVGVMPGVYTVRCVGGAFDAAIAAAAGNAGDGVATLHTTKTSLGVVPGAYKATCLEPAANGGRFMVEDPAGVRIGTAVVGTLFDGVVKFTIADGAADFSAGDSFTITVSNVVSADSGTFEVRSPAGAVLGTASVGSAFATQVKFTITDGATDFAVGDGFDITVATGSGAYVPCNPAAIDGSQTAVAVLIDWVDARGEADKRAVVLVGFAEVAMAYMTWPVAFDTLAKKRAAMAQLAVRHILNRPVA